MVVWKVFFLIPTVAGVAVAVQWVFTHKWYFVTKIVLTYCEKKSSSNREKLLKFEAEGRGFPNILRLLEHLIQTVKGQKNFGNRMLNWKEMLGFRNMQEKLEKEE